MSDMIRNYEEVDTIDELDRILDLYNNYSIDDKRKNWEKVSLSKEMFGGFPETLCNLEPFSKEYKEVVTDFYKLLHKKQYTTENEGFSVDDVEQFSKIGFPYYTNSASVVGDYLMAYGFIIRNMDLPTGAKILDIGSGPGSLTVHLMKMGYQLTCVDVNQWYVELIKKIAKGIGVDVQALCCDMVEIQTNEKFDAVIFMESFHHTLDPEKVMDIVVNCLTDDGKVFFAAEPIVPDDKYVPYPWGPRLDLESIYSIRQYCWIEMGYQENYFRELLMKHGLHYKRTRSNETWWGDVIECKRIPKISLNSNYIFGSNGNGMSMLGSGWSEPEDEHIWSISKEAFFGFMFDDVSPGIIKLEICYVVFLYGDFNEQVINVSVNNKCVDVWRMAGNRMIEMKKILTVEIESITDAQVIKFGFKTPISPREVGLSADDRKLGIALKKLRIL